MLNRGRLTTGRAGGDNVADESERADEPELGTLVRGIVGDAETLIGQQFDLLRSELRQELGRAGAAGLTLGAGAAMLAAGGALGALMAVHALHRATRLPLWACYGLVAGTLGAGGAHLVAAGRREAAGVSLVPTQTVGALQENLAWLRDRAIPPTT